MGIDLDIWTGRIIAQKKGVVRLLPVAERARELFGEDGAGAAADWIESDPNASLQQKLFPEMDAAPKPRNRRRGKEDPSRRRCRTSDTRCHRTGPHSRGHAATGQRPRQCVADVDSLPSRIAVPTS